jgi:glucokinase
VIASLEPLIAEFTGSQEEAPRAIGVACAGQIDPTTGAVVYAPNLGWHDVPLAARLKETFHLPVVVENDVRAAAWGEFAFGAGEGRGTLIAIFVGTGVGSGAVLAGALWRGAGNVAGEVGHTQVVADGLPCRCGRRGCLEQYVSGSGFQRRLDAAAHGGRRSRLLEAHGGEAARVTALDVYEAAGAGDELARELWDDAERYLVMAAANYVTLVNPDVLVLGGGVIETVPALFEAVVRAVPALTTLVAGRALRIERARLGDLSGLIGAAALATPA